MIKPLLSGGKLWNQVEDEIEIKEWVQNITNLMWDLFSKLVKGQIAFNDVFRLPEFTHGGKWEVVDDWRNDANGGVHQLRWTKEGVEGKIKEFEVSPGGNPIK